MTTRDEELLKRYPVVVVDDEVDNLEVIRLNLKRFFDLRTVDSAPKALRMLENLGPVVLLTDQRMPEMTGMELIERALEIQPDTVPIILTAYQDVDVLLRAMGQVHRFIIKPWKRDELKEILAQAIELLHLRLENKRLQERLKRYTGYLEDELRRARSYGTLVAESEAMRHVVELVEKAARSDQPVYLHGEPGVGKEMVAYEIHARGGRKKAPFVRIDCRDHTIRSIRNELLGDGDRSIGAIEAAYGGTLLLDSVTALPKDAQKEVGEIIRRHREAVRFLATALEPLKSAVDNSILIPELAGAFTIEIRVPPLRERRDDLYTLVKVLVERIAHEAGREIVSIEGEAMARLMSHHWPGNVRELEAVLEHGVLASEDGVLRGEVLMFAESSSPGLMVDLERYLEEEEKRFILQALRRARGNVSLAARLLGLSRPTLYYKMKKHGISQEE